MDLHTIEPGPMDGIARRRCKELHILLDLRRRQSSGLPLVTGELDIRGGDHVEGRILACEDLSVRGAAKGPNLHEDEGPLRMYRVCHL